MSSGSLGLKARIAIIVVGVGILPGLIDTVFMLVGLNLQFAQRIQVNMLNIALAAVGAAILVPTRFLATACTVPDSPDPH